MRRQEFAGHRSSYRRRSNEGKGQRIVYESEIWQLDIRIFIVPYRRNRIHANINTPDVAIAGITAIRERPTREEDGQFAGRKVLPGPPSYDHRAINGGDASRFVRHLEKALQSPPLFQ